MPRKDESVEVLLALFTDPVPEATQPTVVARLNEVLRPLLPGVPPARLEGGKLDALGLADYHSGRDVVGDCIFAFWEYSDSYLRVEVLISPVERVENEHGEPEVRVAHYQDSLFTRKETRPEQFEQFKAWRARGEWPKYEYLG